MSDVASLDLCRELYELIGWSTGRWFTEANPTAGYDTGDRELDRSRRMVAPKYTLGYLLRQLETSKHSISVEYHSQDDPLAMDLGNWPGKYTACTADMPQYKYPVADTPEDALCELAIELCKNGELTREATS